MKRSKAGALPLDPVKGEAFEIHSLGVQRTTVLCRVQGRALA
jgi:hypothetical protein